MFFFSMYQRIFRNLTALYIQTTTPFGSGAVAIACSKSILKPSLKTQL